MNQDCLEKVNNPTDLKALSLKELNEYAEAVRDYIIQTVNVQGGHLSSNLGTIELSIALHYVFNAPYDKIIWDVGHQSYTHKIITGRRKSFSKLRTNDGITGFPNIEESEYDSFTMGHSSTSLSVGLGMARARSLSKESYNIISVIGDGAFTGGMAYEALNDIGSNNEKMIIILNDNKMSISKNVGAMSKYFAKLRQSKAYFKFKRNMKKGVSALPFFGDRIVGSLEKVRDVARSVVQTNKMFEQMGIKYIGPFEGHNIADLISILKSANKDTRPILIHILTNKGQGYEEALQNPSKYHGISPKNHDYSNSYSEIIGEKLSELASNNDKIVTITAAMSTGTGLDIFAEKYPDRYFDVGIAEGHAVSMAAGLAKQNYKPYFAVYSSFLQRGYDQMIHDVGISELPVTFLIDRAGVIGSDGVTHQGIFDLSYLNSIPTMTILAPKDGNELKKMLEWSQNFNKPLAIRYPKAYKTEFTCCKEIELGKWEVLKEFQSNVYILCVGNRMLDIAHKIKNANIINARFVKPLDTEYLSKINKHGNIIITMEDNIVVGGFGEACLTYLNSISLKAIIKIIGINNNYVKNLDIDESFKENNVTCEYIESFIESLR